MRNTRLVAEIGGNVLVPLRLVGRFEVATRACVRGFGIGFAHLADTSPRSGGDIYPVDHRLKLGTSRGAGVPLVEIATAVVADEFVLIRGLDLMPKGIAQIRVVDLPTPVAGPLREVLDEHTAGNVSDCLKRDATLPTGV